MTEEWTTTRWKSFHKNELTREASRITDNAWNIVQERMTGRILITFPVLRYVMSYSYLNLFCPVPFTIPMSWCQRSREIPRRSKSFLLTGTSGDVLQCVLLRGMFLLQWNMLMISIANRYRGSSIMKHRDRRQSRKQISNQSYSNRTL